MAELKVFLLFETKNTKSIDKEGQSKRTDTIEP